MFKRLKWFTVGTAAGICGSLYARRRAKQVVEQLAPPQLQGMAKRKLRDTANRVVDAVHEGAAAMREREAELRGLRPADRATIDTTGRATAESTAHSPARRRSLPPARPAASPLRAREAAR